MAPSFVHLHVHTEYSVVDSTIRIKELLAATAELGMPAVAMSDMSNVFGMIKFYRQSLAAGIKPLIGAEIKLAGDLGTLVLICMDNGGYKNLSRLLTRAYIEGQERGEPEVEFAWLEEYADGLIALSGGMAGELGRAIGTGNQDTALQVASKYRRLFGDRFYIELQRTGHNGEQTYNEAALAVARETATPVVATNNVRFLREDDFEIHEVRVCINQGRVLSDTRRPRNYTPRQYLKSPEAMIELFRDIPEAIENTVQIAIRCNVKIELGTNYLPDYPVPDGDDVVAVLRRESETGLKRILKSASEERWPEYHERLELELGVIISMGFAGYFMIVADFISWAKDNGIPVGPGRGSGAGSLVAYALKITDLDPIEHGLLFERFLNPERVSLPDFDVDFCMENRDQVIEYVTRKYGHDRVSQIITYGTMAARAVIRDVGRVMDLPYGFVDQIAKLIPGGPGVTLGKSMDEEEPLKTRYEEDAEVRELVDTALRLEGLTRNVGKHAGGVVIAPSALTEFSPLYCEPGNEAKVTQFDKDDLEAVGLVKFDFLGLRTLTIIDWAIKNIQRTEGTLISLEGELNPFHNADPEPFELLKQARTTAMFQLESRGMKEIIRKLKPDCFDDMVALVALFRPGPLQSGMVDDFINRKHGRAEISYPHPSLAPILKPTYGVILYQEQVMQIAQVLSGYTLGAADLLRRAMGKKKAEVMEQQRSGFISGAEKNGVDAATAESIFNLIEKFAGYGFNKSHSAAYALVSYHTAWLKCHYPAQFMAAVLSADMENTDKVVDLIQDCGEFGLEILPPDINQCEYQFMPLDRKRMHYGLGAIKGAGRAALESMVEERKANGSYRDLYDLCARADTHKANRRVLEALIKAGAMDSLGSHRAELMENIGHAMNAADQQSRASRVGQSDLFGLSGLANTRTEMVQVPAWPDKTRLEGEKETLGMYLSGHPMDAYSRELEALVDFNLAELKPNKQPKLVAGIVGAFRVMRTRRGKKMAYLSLDDHKGSLEVVVFPELFEQYRSMLKKDQLLVISGVIETDDYSGGHKMVADRLMSLDQAREMMAGQLDIHLDENTQSSVLDRIQTILTEVREGDCPVTFHISGQGWHCRIPLGRDWEVYPDGNILDALSSVIGENRAAFKYNRRTESARIFAFPDQGRKTNPQTNGQAHESEFS